MVRFLCCYYPNYISVTGDSLGEGKMAGKGTAAVPRVSRTIRDGEAGHKGPADSCLSLRESSAVVLDLKATSVRYFRGAKGDVRRRAPRYCTGLSTIAWRFITPSPTRFFALTVRM